MPTENEPDELTPADAEKVGGADTAWDPLRCFEDLIEKVREILW